MGVDILRLTRIKVEILKWLAVIGGSRWVVVWLKSSLARVLTRRLGEYAGKRILTEAQGGFRANRSCSDQVQCSRAREPTFKTLY